MLGAGARTATAPQWVMLSELSLTPQSPGSGRTHPGAELHAPGKEPSQLPGLAAGKRCIMGEGIWPRLRWEKQPGLGAFSQALLGRLLKVTPTSNKTFSDTKKGSTWPVPGLAWHLNSAVQVLGAQTGHAVSDALLPPLLECQEPAVALSGLLPLLTQGPN